VGPRLRLSASARLEALRMTPGYTPSRIRHARFFGLTFDPKRRYSGYMSTQDDRERLELLQGTLDLLILRTLIFGSQHGQGIARAIQDTSEKELLVEHGALYPALQRLEERGWISAKWGVSSNNRKARFYSLTAVGRKQLVRETHKWKRLTGAIARILGPESAES
jgi:PadR family transcriptional regulator PadR